MNLKNQAFEQKEKERKMKELRKELETQLEEQLATVAAESETPAPSPEGQARANEPVTLERARQIIEALLFASSKPLMAEDIKRVVKGVTPKQIEACVQELRDAYARENRSFEILEIAGGYEISSKKEFAPWIYRIELQKRVKQATQSALETLAILAYKQPITRAEIEELRGVDVSGVLNTLVERSLIKIVGRKEVPGRPFLYGTTEKFLEHFGLKSLQDLPSIEEVRTIVEKSVKKEELLGRPQIVPVNSSPEEKADEGGTPDRDESPDEVPGEATADAPLPEETPLPEVPSQDQPIQTNQENQIGS